VSDIVERLLEELPFPTNAATQRKLMLEAAQEIQHLRSQIADLNLQLFEAQR
jgi:hypothetical protein